MPHTAEEVAQRIRELEQEEQAAKATPQTPEPSAAPAEPQYQSAKDFYLHDPMFSQFTEDRPAPDVAGNLGRMAIPTALSVGAGMIPGGAIAQTLYQALAGYLGRKTNVGLGLEEPGMKQDVLSAAVPGAMVGGGNLINALARGTGSIANGALRFQTPEQQAISKAALDEQFAGQKATIQGDYQAANEAHAASEAVRKTDLGEQWANTKSGIQAAAEREQQAVLDAQRAQYEAEKAKYQSDKVAFGEQSLRTANQLLAQDQPPVPAASIYADLNKNVTPVQLNNLRASQEKFGSLAEAKALALGFQPNPALERISPQIATEEPGLMPLTREMRDEALRNEVGEYMNYRQQGGTAPTLLDYRRLKDQLAANDAALLSDSAPANVLISSIQETNRLIGAARRSGNGQLEGVLRQHQAAMWKDLAQYPDISGDFKAAQSAQRRQFADEDFKGMVASSTRRVQMPGEPLTETLDIGSLLKKVDKLRQDPLFEGSYPKGYLDRYVSTLKALSGEVPTRPVRPEPPQFAPLEPMQAPSFLPTPGPEAPSPLQPPMMIPAPSKASGVLKVFSGGLGAVLGHQIGHPYMGMALGYAGLDSALSKIAQSPVAQNMLVQVSKAAEGRVSQEALAQIAAFADAERARENGRKLGVEVIKPSENEMKNVDYGVTK